MYSDIIGPLRLSELLKTGGFIVSESDISFFF